MSINGTLYSWGKHFPLARLHETRIVNFRVALIRNYADCTSHSTRVHHGLVTSETFKHGIKTFMVKDVLAETFEEHEQNLVHICHMANEYLIHARKRRITMYAERDLSLASNVIDYCESYCNHFGLVLSSRVTQAREEVSKAIAVERLAVMFKQAAGR
jgi:hypothetical protein